MHALWKKMQIKDHTRFLILAAPEEFAPIRADVDSTWTVVERDGLFPAGDDLFDVVVMFLQTEADVAGAAEVIRKNVAGDDTLVWMCYPKKSSKRYEARINRDVGWNPVIDLGWEGVRQVAVDDDWSALRFRPRDAIKSYTRKTQIGRS